MTGEQTGRGDGPQERPVPLFFSLKLCLLGYVAGAGMVLLVGWLW